MLIFFFLIQEASYRVLVKFWSRQLGCKSRRPGNRVRFSLSSISWKSSWLNTRSRQFFQPVINENLDPRFLLLVNISALEILTHCCLFAGLNRNLVLATYLWLVANQKLTFGPKSISEFYNGKYSKFFC